MTAALTPPIALDYLRQLSTDIRAAVVLDAAGELLAGDVSIALAARDLIAAIEDRSGHVAIATSAGVVVAARGGNGVAIVVAAGPFALVSLLSHDVRAALAALTKAGYPSAAEHRERAADPGPDAVRAAGALLAAAGLRD